MRAEIALLKAVVSMQQQQQQQQPVLPTVRVVMDEGVLQDAEPPLPAPTAHIEELPTSTPTPPPVAAPQPVHGVEPWWNLPGSYTHETRSPLIPAFIEGSSSRPLSRPQPQPYIQHHLDNALSPDMLSPLESGYSPSLLSPGSTTMSDSASAAPSPSAVPRRKRKTSHVVSSPNSSSDESDMPPGGGPRKRRNGHDTRCLTIQVNAFLICPGTCLWNLNIPRLPFVPTYTDACPRSRPAYCLKALKVTHWATRTPYASTGAKPPANLLTTDA